MGYFETGRHFVELINYSQGVTKEQVSVKLSHYLTNMTIKLPETTQEAKDRKVSKLISDRVPSRIGGPQ